uniref:Uncharacterized protein n=1 Tax=Anguilla anguilla TaxID=7936 RepID=A0A0E9WNH9_ANGAN
MMHCRPSIAQCNLYLYFFFMKCITTMYPGCAIPSACISHRYELSIQT